MFTESNFRVFREIVAGGGTVRGFVVKNAGGYSRSEVDGIVDRAKQMGAAGLVWARRAEDGTVTSSVMKALGESEVVSMLDAASVGAGEVLLVAAGEPDATSKLLGQIRLGLARQKGLLDPDASAFVWVVDFPLMEFDAAENRSADFRIGCINANKLWLNGALLTANQIYHSGMEVDQYVATAQLKKGRNTILVKVAQNEQEENWAQRWQFQLRVCDELGTALLTK